MKRLLSIAWLGLSSAVLATTIEQFEQYPSPIPLVSSQMLYPEFWIKLEADSQTVIMTSEQIAEYNLWNSKNTKALVDWDTLPNELSQKELSDYVDAISGSGGALLQYPTRGFRYDNGQELTAKDYARYNENLNIDAIKEQNPIRFGLVVKRELLRRFPTLDEVRNRGLSKHVNMFVETAAFPGEAVAVLHTSKDGKFFLVRKHDYLAWIPTQAVAIGNRQEVMQYINPAKFLVVTAPKIELEFNPETPQISQRVYDMGCVLPLATQVPKKIGGRHSFGCFVVNVPVREANGNLSIRPALLPRANDVSLGFLPYTKENLLRQSFKFVGERYGWGDMYEGRDCSGIIRNVFSTFGFRMARNGTEQNLQMRGKFWDFSNKSAQERQQMLNELKLGDILRFPGHTVMFLGRNNGKSFIFHDTSGSSFMQNNRVINIPFWGVGVTPLEEMVVDADTRYLDTIQNAKRLQ